MASSKRKPPFSGTNSLNKRVVHPTFLGSFVSTNFNLALCKPKDEPSIRESPSVLETISKPDSDVETVETLSPAEPITLEYRIMGLTLGTPEILNTCHIDSFLSAFVRKVRQTHGKMLNKILYRDSVGEALIKIGEHALQAKNSLDSAFIKKIWLDTVLQTPLQVPFDAAGLQEFSIFQHLYHHSGFHLESKCRCGTQYICEATLKGNSLRDLQAVLADMKGCNSILPYCKTCQLKRTYVSLTPLKSNWLLTILYQSSDVPDFDEIIPVYEIQGKLYKLAYLGYKFSPQFTGFSIGHIVSLQYIRDAWYIYDGLKSPAFTLWDNRIRFDKPGACLESLVYFQI